MITEDEIIKKYPSQFPTLKKIHVREGWLPLIDKLCTTVHQKLSEAEHDGFFWTDIKSDHAELYANFIGPAFLDDIIDDFTDIAMETCEICGQPGSLQNGPWEEILCPKHKKIT